jgi:hypothetical protein
MDLYQDKRRQLDIIGYLQRILFCGYSLTSYPNFLTISLYILSYPSYPIISHDILGEEIPDGQPSNPHISANVFGDQDVSARLAEAEGDWRLQLARKDSGPSTLAESIKIGSGSVPSTYPVTICSVPLISFVISTLLGRQAQWATLFRRHFH